MKIIKIIKQIRDKNKMVLPPDQYFVKPSVDYLQPAECSKLLNVKACELYPIVVAKMQESSMTADDIVNIAYNDLFGYALERREKEGMIFSNAKDIGSEFMSNYNKGFGGINLKDKGNVLYAIHDAQEVMIGYVEKQGLPLEAKLSVRLDKANDRLEKMSSQIQATPFNSIDGGILNYDAKTHMKSDISIGVIGVILFTGLYFYNKRNNKADADK